MLIDLINYGIHILFLFNTFTAEEFLETRPVMHLSKHIFPSQELQKYLSYEALFFSKCLKVNVDSKNAMKIREKVFTSSPKISDLTKNDFFLTRFGSEWWKSLIKVLFCRFQQFLGLVNTFTGEGFSEARLFMHLSKYVFRSQ